ADAQRNADERPRTPGLLRADKWDRKKSKDKAGDWECGTLLQVDLQFECAYTQFSELPDMSAQLPVAHLARFIRRSFEQAYAIAYFDELGLRLNSPSYDRRVRRDVLYPTAVGFPVPGVHLSRPVEMDRRPDQAAVVVELIY